MSRSIRQTYPTRVEITGNIEVHHPVKETIYCPAQTRSARMFVDPEPAEYCTNEVADYGDYCEVHDYTDQDAADDARGHDYEARMGY